MHFIILKMIATSGFLTALECIIFVFGQSSDLDPAGGAYSSSPDPLASLSRDPTSKWKGGKGREEGVEEREEGGGNWGTPPNANSWIRP